MKNIFNSKTARGIGKIPKAPDWDDLWASRIKNLRAWSQGDHGTKFKKDAFRKCRFWDLCDNLGTVGGTGSCKVSKRVGPRAGPDEPSWSSIGRGCGVTVTSEGPNFALFGTFSNRRYQKLARGTGTC